jgi:hypothetical protein
MACTFSRPPTITISALLLVIFAVHTLSTIHCMPTPSSPLRSKCACGSTTVSINIPDITQYKLIDCHCPACRKFHTATFASFLKVPSECVSMKTKDNNSLTVYQDSCLELGSVERIICKTCNSKLLTNAKSAGTTGTTETTETYINLGPVVDSTLPKALANKWKKERVSVQYEHVAKWANARPGTKPDPNTTTKQLVSGGSCACGTWSYTILNDNDHHHHLLPLELQHCYCKLCRQLSGAAFQTWIPVDRQDLHWHSTVAGAGEPQLVRTTNHGRRHVCETCKSVMTIVYDDQPNMVWPVAGSLHDEFAASLSYDRVIHICCRYKQAWYELPTDGLERVQEAC